MNIRFIVELFFVYHSLHDFYCSNNAFFLVA